MDLDFNRPSVLFKSLFGLIFEGQYEKSYF